MKRTQDLLRFKKNDRIVFDFETFNLNLGDFNVNLPWQLGWLVIRDNKIVEAHEDWIWWPNYKKMISKEAAEKTGFKDTVYEKKAQDPFPILKKFNSYLYNTDYLILAANPHKFDVYIHSLYCRRMGFYPVDYSYINRLMCVQNLYKAEILEQSIPKVGDKDWASFNYKMSNYVRKGLKYNLELLAKHYSVPYDPKKHHVSALYDVELTNDIFLAQISKIDV